MMEMAKVDKRTKAYKESMGAEGPEEAASEDSKIAAMVRIGIPVSKAHFQSAVNNADNVPENYFSETSNNSNRRCEMWWIPSGLLCTQKGKYFIVPHANIIFANFK